jgi:polysaccharide pyruvyl transferase WcaK-like protein
MKILLINNCEKYHSGSAEVTTFFKSELETYNLTILKSIKKINEYNLLDYDVIIANGEGTMHDNASKALEILNILKAGKNLGLKTLLVNSVWQNNNRYLIDLLEYVDYISVREINSKNEILTFSKKEIDVNLDVSFFTNVDIDSNISNRQGIVAGNRYENGRKPKISGINETGTIDIFSQSWKEIINILKRSKVLVTGRHHEMYAACKAECPCIILEGNTHKNSGFLKTMNCNIPVLPTNASNQDIINLLENIDTYSTEYTKLFSKLKTIEKPNFLKNAGLV